MNTAASRTVYATAADPECGPPGTRLLAAIRTEIGTGGDAGGGSAGDRAGEEPQALRSSVAAWSRDAARRFRELYGTCDSDGSRDALVRRVALDCAPLALVSGAWLQGLSSPGGAEDPESLRVLARYAQDVGVGRPGASRGSAFLALLRDLELAEYASSAPTLAHDRRIDDDAFGLPARLLTMSRAPERFRDELLGADACLRATGLLPPLALLREAWPDARWERIDLSSARAGTDGRCPDPDRSPEARAGFRWAFAALRRWADGLYLRLEAARDPAHGVAELLRERAREAAVYHHDFRLEGRPLADWLAECRSDPWPLVGALARSRLVRPGRAEASPLVNGLVGERGAMFRVFTPEELTVLRHWIDSLPTDTADTADTTDTTGHEAPAPARRRGDRPQSPARSTPPGAASHHTGRTPESGRHAGARPALREPTVHTPQPAPHANTRPACREFAPGAVGPGRAADDPASRKSARSDVLPAWRSDGDEWGREPEGLREAYRMLQSRTDTPALCDWAAGYARDWLDRARRSVDQGAYRLPDGWPAGGLRSWLSEQHERHAEEFTAGQDAPLPSREVLVESTLQLAPLTMIDGAWLHGFTDYALAAAQPGCALFETYWDELGNGDPDLNHPRIYRELLAEMGVEPPPGGSAEFAGWPRFAEESFALPVFWLAVGRFPRTLQPEILGLNLAMELSGVGGSYRRARLALRRHGFSTRFVDIHNTIDNVAGGHAAWACDAVDSHLAALPGGGSGAREAAWARVRAGFRSLSLDPGPTMSPARRLVRRLRRTVHA
ncbi:conserved hypothetical protein [Streptomyces viridochromogenes DSM 40736]|uniref:IopB n=1 Tax=Streptomyces viridochromogenes (strain DSM 40736 / JCM 4977 / BCRC 1201 / Tue 494) TaxID=591159 RepID=D9X6T5_STRVT|nr:iron-containing redox enzyme family protein [Streptomyces viridochromogenes]EFL34002.1 conserved hypothetical protein [Streptomyces viridochromogenes DSM 40736]